MNSRRFIYSITSSASASSLSGTVTPSVRRLEIDNEIEFRWLFNRNVGRFRTPDDFVDVKRGSLVKR
jgi:hypothetical protein